MVSTAIHIINLPTNLDTQVTHRYSANSFKLHRLPTPRPGQVLGLVGTNGIGKSTALKILSGKQKPNLGRYENPPDWNETLAYFRGSELQNYLTKVVEDNLKAVVKPQYVDKLPMAIKSKERTVGKLMKIQSQMGNMEEMIDILGMRTSQFQCGYMLTAEFQTSVRYWIEKWNNFLVESFKGSQLPLPVYRRLTCNSHLKTLYYMKCMN